MRKLLASVALFGVAGILSAETLSYHYDAQGRLIQSSSSTTGLRSDYTYDAAGNRQRVQSQTTTFVMSAGQSKYSSDNRFRLTMRQDGDLVLSGPSGTLWRSGTSGTNANRAEMRADGNLVVYNAANQSFWTSGTGGHPASVLTVQPDGNMVISDGKKVPIWSTGTRGD